MGRPTDEKKDLQITIRVSEKTREKLEEDAKKNGMNLSEYLRKLVKDSL